MEWMDTIGPAWLTTFLWMAGLAIVLGILAWLMPCNRGMFWWRDLRAVAADGMYWFIVPLFMRACRLAMLIGGVMLLFGGTESRLLPVAQLPLWQQCLAILIIQDVMMYWIHRLFHTRWAWKVHAVHHSPTVLDWMSASRFHPLNVLLSSCLPDVSVLLLGFSPEALAVLVPVNIVYSTMVHANLSWTFGPLRFLFASPVFHRWHHTTLDEGLNKNFAPTFPILDVIFGTFYMPPGKAPEHYGTGEADFPTGFWGQLLHPFRSSSQPSANSALPAGRFARIQSIAFTAGLALAFLGLFAGGMFLMTRFSDQNREWVQSVDQAPLARNELQLDLAQRAWMENDLVSATAILDGAAAPLQETNEHRHLRELCRDKCLILAGHKGAVLAVAVSDDGKRVASSAEDGMLKVWDVATTKEICTIKVPGRASRNVALRSDGGVVLSGGSDGAVRIWDVSNTALLQVLPEHSIPVLGLAISADGKHVLTGSADMTAKLCETNNGRDKLTLRGHIGAVPCVAISGDGERLVRASGNVIRVWNVRLGGEECTLTGHRDLVYSVAISRDGKQVVSGSFDRTIKLWNVAEGREERTFTGHTGNVYGVAIAPEGQLIVSGGEDGMVKVWDAVTGLQEASLRGHTDSVTSVAISANASHVVSGSRDGTVKVWNLEKCLPKSMHRETALTSASRGTSSDREASPHR